MVLREQAEPIVWGLLAISFAVACALGYVKTYPLAIQPPPLIGGKAVPARILERKHYLADKLRALEKRADRAADRLDDAPARGPVPARTFLDLQGIHLQFARVEEPMDGAVRRRIWKTLTQVRQAALSDDPAQTRKALRKLQVRLAVARYAP